MADYEQSDAIPGRLLGFGLATLLLVVLSALAMGWLHHAWRQAPGPLAPVAVETPVDPDPAELHRYQWLDRSQGLVQIPIEEAMQVVSQGGSRASGATANPILGDSPGGPAGPPVRAASGSPNPGFEPER